VTSLRVAWSRDTRASGRGSPGAAEIYRPTQITSDGLTIGLVRTIAQRSLLSLPFALIVIFAPQWRGVEQSPAQEQPLQPLYRELDSLFRRYYPTWRLRL